jgi:sugar lactone lactonase YvrE
MRRLCLGILSVLLVAMPIMAAAQGSVVWQNQRPASSDSDGYGDLGGVAIGNDGTIYVADSFVGVQVLASDGTWQQTISNKEISSADDVAWGTDGTLWVADSLANRVYHINLDGSIINQFGEPGSGAGQFGELSPVELELAPNGTVYVFDTQEDGQGNQVGRIQIFDANGNFQGEFSTDPQNTGAGASMRLAVDGRGNIYAADFFGGITVFSSSGELLAENLLQDDMRFASVDALTLGDDGFLYVAVDGEIYQLDNRGAIAGVLGEAQSDSQDSQQFAVGEFGEVRGMALLPDGDLIVSSTNYDWSQIVRLHFD